MEEKLPISNDLIFMRYEDGAEDDDDDDESEERKDHPTFNPITGFVFFYPSMDLCRVIEIEITSA